MIAKQYLITGILMGIIGGVISLLFRLQLAWPEQSFKIFSIVLGDSYAPNGVMLNDRYLALVTIHGTIMVFFVLTAALSGTFSNLLIPLQLGARDMASGFLNMVSYWLFFLSSVIMVRTCICWLDNLSAIKRIASSYTWFWSGNDTLVSFNGYIYCSILDGVVKLYCNRY